MMTWNPPDHPRSTARAVGIALAATLTIPAPTLAQAATDLFLVRFDGSGPEMDVVVTRITDRDGYDNQPFFTPDGGAVLFTSIREGQADIYRYDVGTGETSQIVATSESEYSPTVMPGGSRFSVVRVEADSTQRLWSFAMDGSDPQLVLPGIAPVGYHAWLSETRVALFVLGSPATLQLADLTTGDAWVVAEDIGRSVHGVPDTEMVSFLWRTDEGAWITAFDPGREHFERLAAPMESNEFHAWLPEGTLLSADYSTLYVAHPPSYEWQAVADLAEYGIHNISRIAVGPGGETLVIVGGR